MLNKYYQIYELLQKILKISKFNDVAFTCPMISDHKLVGMRRKEGYLIGVYSERHSMNVFSLQTQNVFSDKDFKASSVNVRTKNGGSSNIQASCVMDVYAYKEDIQTLQLSTGINLGTGEGSDEIFQMSTLHPDVVTDCWALLSHYKIHGLSDLYHLGWSGHLPEAVLGMLILKLQVILKEIE